MDSYFPSGDPASFTALYAAPPTPSLPAQRAGSQAPTRIPLCVVNGAGGLVSMLEFTEPVGPEQVLLAAGWHRTEAWRLDADGRCWARIEPAQHDSSHRPPLAPLRPARS